MDIATIIGIITAYSMIFLGMRGQFGAFINLPSVFIVVGGTIGSLFMAYPLNKVLNVTGVVKNAFFVHKTTPAQTIKQLVEFAEQARREGILALESRSQEVDNEFLQKGIQLAVDGTEPELIKEILTTEVNFLEQRHEESAKFFIFGGGIAPAFGMIGTLMGLILMLGQMSSVETIGPNMAVALITTMYGSILANTIFLPIAEKLKANSQKEILEKELMLEGIMAIQSGDNPRIVEQKLVAFIEPSVRATAMKER